MFIYSQTRFALEFLVLVSYAAVLWSNTPVSALSEKSHHGSTPRYLNQYLRAKQGIDAEERALQARLHAEISTDFQHLDGDSGSPEKHKSEHHKKAITKLREHARARQRAAAKDILVKHRLKVKRLAKQRLVLTAHAKKVTDKTPVQPSDAGIKSTSVTNSAAHPKTPPPPHFDINTVHRFDPGQSLSFARELFETFALSYADTSLMTGYVGRDIVQLGAAPFAGDTLPFVRLARPTMIEAGHASYHASVSESVKRQD
jgi:hypothetical protein